MKALEKRCVFMGDKDFSDKKWHQHRERLKQVKKSVDNSQPYTWNKKHDSPTKQQGARREAKDHINKENYFLARRIFDIMEGQSALSEQINDTSHLDNHPGTMNFKQRLREAQRIHERNMILASRLDTIQPYYRNADLSVVQYRGKTPQRRETDKTKFMKEMEITLQMANRLPLTEEESENVVGGMGYYKDFKFTDFYRDKIRNQRGGRDEQTSSSKPRNLLLEYTKSQNNRMLDIAVVKEPFKDRYIIFGMDVDNGQRYELRLTSEDVSDILDGDILVTSVDNVEVWMALLNKVNLQPVDAFEQADMDFMDTPPHEIAPAVSARMEPFAPDAASRPTASSGGRRRQRGAAPPQSSDENSMLDAFAGPTEEGEVFSDKPAVPPKKKAGVRIAVGEEDEDAPKKDTKWEAPALTPKPPDRKHMSSRPQVDKKLANITAVNTNLNAVVVLSPKAVAPVALTPASAPVATKPTPVPKPQQSPAAKPTLIAKAAPAAIVVAPKKPVAPVNKPSGPPVNNGRRSISAAKPSQPAAPTAVVKVAAPPSPRSKPATSSKPAPVVPKAASDKQPPATEKAMDPDQASYISKVVTEHAAVQEQAALTVDMAISSALQVVRCLSPSSFGQQQQHGQQLQDATEQEDVFSSSYVLDDFRGGDVHTDVPPVYTAIQPDVESDDRYLESSFEEMSLTSSPRQHNEDAPVGQPLRCL